MSEIGIELTSILNFHTPDLSFLRVARLFIHLLHLITVLHSCPLLNLDFYYMAKALCCQSRLLC